MRVTTTHVGTGAPARPVEQISTVFRSGTAGKGTTLVVPTSVGMKAALAAEVNA
jgi:hypothetical protein